MKFTVRRMGDLGVPVLQRLRRELTNSGTRGDLRDDGAPARSNLQNRIHDHLTGARPFERTWGIFAHETYLVTAGWCLLTEQQDPGLITRTATVGFYVHPSFRRRGLGTDLVSEAAALARKTGIGRLLANPWNNSSRTFFSSCGFRSLAREAALPHVEVVVRDL